MTDNVYTLPNVLADRIRAAYQKSEQSHTAWIEATLELAALLQEARAQCKSDRQFGHWLVDNDLDAIGSDDRAALIAMAGDLSLARIVLEETQRVSWRWIWLEEMQPRFRHVAKPAAITTLPAENAVSAPHEPQTPIPPSGEPRVSVSKVGATVSQRAKTMSALARMHERAYVAVTSVTDKSSKLRSAFNEFCVSANGPNHPLWVRWLDSLADEIETGRLQLPRTGSCLQLGWGFPNGIGRPDGPALAKQKFGIDQRKEFFQALRSVLAVPTPSTAATTPMPQEPVSLPSSARIAQHSVGPAQVTVNDHAIHPLPHQRWELDDACVAVDLVRTLWAYCIATPERLRAEQFARLLQRNFVELRYAASFEGLVNAIQYVSVVLDKLPPEQKTRPLDCQMPSRPTKYARP